MKCLIELLLATLVSIQASEFNKPILADKSYSSQSALKVNGTYYNVATTEDITKGIFPIHTSADLMEWKSAGYVFDESNAPAWASNTSLYYSSMHQIGPNFLVYFSAHNKTSTYPEIGVAIAAHPLGPYTFTDRPMVSQSNISLRYPAIIHDEDKLYLMWSKNTTDIMARQLNPHGLSFSSEQTISILKPSLTWENGKVYASSYFRRENFHYLVYSAYWECNDTKIGVARSISALGPYEKLSHPIIVSNADVTCPDNANLVKDLDDKSDLIFFKAYTDHIRSVFLSTINWNVESWPYVDQL